MYITLIPQLRSSHILMGILVLAVSLNSLSVYRAHKADVGLSRLGTLRKKDLQILEMSRQYLWEQRRAPVHLEDREVTFAQFPVVVTKEQRPFVLSL